MCDAKVIWTLFRDVSGIVAFDEAPCSTFVLCGCCLPDDTMAFLDMHPKSPDHPEPLICLHKGINI